MGWRFPNWCVVVYSIRSIWTSKVNHKRFRRHRSLPHRGSSGGNYVLAPPEFFVCALKRRARCCRVAWLPPSRPARGFACLACGSGTFASWRHRAICCWVGVPVLPPPRCINEPVPFLTGKANPMHTSPDTPANHPIHLQADLYAEDDTRAPQT